MGGSPGGASKSPPPCTSMFVELAAAELTLGTGTTTAPAPPFLSDNIFLSLVFVQKLAASLAAKPCQWTDTVSRPIMQGAAEALGKLVDRHSDTVAQLSTHPAPRRAVRSCCCAASCTVEVKGRQIGSVFQLAGAYASRCYGCAITDRSVATSGEPRPGRSCGALRPGSAKTSTWPKTYALAHY